MLPISNYAIILGKETTFPVCSFRDLTKSVVCIKPLPLIKLGGEYVGVTLSGTCSLSPCLSALVFLMMPS